LFHNTTQDKWEVKKGVFPYDFFRGENYQDIEKIMDETELPSHEKFFSILKNNNISAADYEIGLASPFEPPCT